MVPEATWTCWGFAAWAAVRAFSGSKFMILRCGRHFAMHLFPLQAVMSLKVSLEPSLLGKLNGRAAERWGKEWQGVARRSGEKKMRERGVEPLRFYPLDPKSSASASSATLAGGRRIVAEARGSGAVRPGARPRRGPRRPS